MFWVSAESACGRRGAQVLVEIRRCRVSRGIEIDLMTVPPLGRPCCCRGFCNGLLGRRVAASYPPPCPPYRVSSMILEISKSGNAIAIICRGPFTSMLARAHHGYFHSLITCSNAARFSLVVGTESLASFLPPDFPRPSRLPGLGVRLALMPARFGEFFGDFLGDFPLPFVRSARNRAASSCSRTYFEHQWMVRMHRGCYEARGTMSIWAVNVFRRSRVCRVFNVYYVETIETSLFCMRRDWQNVDTGENLFWRSNTENTTVLLNAVIKRKLLPTQRVGRTPAKSILHLDQPVKVCGNLGDPLENRRRTSELPFLVERTLKPPKHTRPPQEMVGGRRYNNKVPSPDARKSTTRPT